MQQRPSRRLGLQRQRSIGEPDRSRLLLAGLAALAELQGRQHGAAAQFAARAVRECECAFGGLEQGLRVIGCAGQPLRVGRHHRELDGDRVAVVDPPAQGLATSGGPGHRFVEGLGRGRFVRRVQGRGRGAQWVGVGGGEPVFGDRHRRAAASFQGGRRRQLEIQSPFGGDQLAGDAADQFVGEPPSVLFSYDDAAVDSGVEIVRADAEVHKQLLVDVAAQHRQGLESPAGGRIECGEAVLHDCPQPWRRGQVLRWLRPVRAVPQHAGALQVGDQLGEKQGIAAGDVVGPARQWPDPATALEQLTDELLDLVDIQTGDGERGRRGAEQARHVARLACHDDGPQCRGAVPQRTQYPPGRRPHAPRVVDHHRGVVVGEHSGQAVDHLVEERQRRPRCQRNGQAEQLANCRPGRGIEQSKFRREGIDDVAQWLQDSFRMPPALHANGARVIARVREARHHRGLADSRLTVDHHDRVFGHQPVQSVREIAPRDARSGTTAHDVGLRAVPQHRALGGEQRGGRIEAEVVGQHSARLLIRGEGVRTATGRVQRPDQPDPAGLVVRVVVDQLLPRPRRVVGTAQLLQRRRRRLREHAQRCLYVLAFALDSVGRQIRVRGAPVQASGRLGGGQHGGPVAAVARIRHLRDQFGEHPDVGRDDCRIEAVPRTGPDDRGLAQAAAQACHVVVQRGAAGCRDLVGPDQCL